jgi:hypothetical protein
MDDVEKRKFLITGSFGLMEGQFGSGPNGTFETPANSTRIMRNF